LEIFRPQWFVLFPSARIPIDPNKLIGTIEFSELSVKDLATIGIHAKK
jgi:hypothetical protein